MPQLLQQIPFALDMAEALEGITAGLAGLKLQGSLYFSGREDEDIAAWVRRWDRHGTAMGWQDVEKLRRAPSYLRGVAEIHYEQLAAGDRDTKDHLFDALRRDFRPEGYHQLKLMELKSLRQAAHESVDDFYHRIMR
ncbi:MAG: hypothetical protein GY813_19695, partial [Halieaceae bacterium]|nr:hypothetical protein [Halieaceae bacterium]